MCVHVCTSWYQEHLELRINGARNFTQTELQQVAFGKGKGVLTLGRKKKRKKIKKYPCQSHLWISCSSMSFTLLLGNSSSRLTLRNLSFQPQDSNEIFITRFILRSVYSEILKIFRSYTFAMSLGVLFQTEGNTFLRLKQCLAHER